VEEFSEPWQVVNRRFFAALLGADVICFSQMLTIPELDVPLTVAAYLFSVAMPLLAFSYLSVTALWWFWQEHWFVVSILGTALVTGFGGVACVFFHFATWAGVIFSILSALSGGLLLDIVIGQERYASRKEAEMLRWKEAKAKESTDTPGRE
jgi:hypothetical protein